MALAHMINIDEAALVCDMAETYRIYDMRALPARTLATMACGLRGESRIMCKMAGVETSPPIVLFMAKIADELAAIRWMLSGDKKNRPEFLVPIILGEVQDPGEAASFSTVDEFERRRKEIIERMNIDG